MINNILFLILGLAILNGYMYLQQPSVEIFHRLGLNIFIVDYRGYGMSRGKASEHGLYKDARTAWHYLTNERGVDQANIILFGRSLGGVIATQLASEIQPGALIIESVFSSARDMANTVLPFLSRLIFLHYEFDTVTRVRRVACPVLVLHSTDDEIIPYRLGVKVFQAANEPKSLVNMMGDHNGGFLMSQPNYQHTLGAFIEKSSRE